MHNYALIMKKMAKNKLINFGKLARTLIDHLFARRDVHGWSRMISARMSQKKIITIYLYISGRGYHNTG